ncbi:hypothetical protein K0U83_15080 [bacterium]|nr:hypothetical protein [bacterium]
MSSSAHRGDFDIGYYEASIEETHSVTAAVGALTNAPAAAEGALRPGRYLVQLSNPTAGTVVWVHVGAFDAAVPLAPANPIAAGTRRIPLSSSGVLAIEFQALTGYSDRIAVQAVGNAATVFISRVSSETRTRS